MKYLVTVAWGMNRSFTDKLKVEAKQAQAKLQSITNNSNTALLIVPALFPVEDDDSRHKSVITDHKLASNFFTARRLFALNRCRELSAADLETHTDSQLHHQRFHQAFLTRCPVVTTNT